MCRLRSNSRASLPTECKRLGRLCIGKYAFTSPLPQNSHRSRNCLFQPWPETHQHSNRSTYRGLTAQCHSGLSYHMMNQIHKQNRKQLTSQQAGYFLCDFNPTPLALSSPLVLQPQGLIVPRQHWARAHACWFDYCLQ